MRHQCSPLCLWQTLRKESNPLNAFQREINEKFCFLRTRFSFITLLLTAALFCNFSPLLNLNGWQNVLNVSMNDNNYIFISDWLKNQTHIFPSKCCLIIFLLRMAFVFLTIKTIFAQRDRSEGKNHSNKIFLRYIFSVK